MRRFVVLATVALVASMGLSACTVTTSKSNSSSNETSEIPNPMKSVDSADALAEVSGIKLAPPEGAADVTFTYVDPTGVAEIDCTLEGRDVTVRAKSADSAEDISGMYETWTDLSSVTTPEGYNVNIRVAGNEAAAIDYFNSAAKTEYCFEVTGTDISVDVATAVYEACIAANPSSVS